MSYLTGMIAPSYWILNRPSDAASHLCVNTDTALSYTHTHTHACICCKVRVHGSLQSAGMSPTLRRPGSDNHQGLIKCWQLTRCPVSAAPPPPECSKKKKRLFLMRHLARVPDASPFLFRDLLTATASCLFALELTLKNK